MMPGAALTRTPLRAVIKKSAAATLAICAIILTQIAAARATLPLPGPEACQKLTQNYQDALNAKDYVSASKIGATLKTLGCEPVAEQSVIPPAPACPQSIRNIVNFLRICPTDDPAYATIVSDFQIRVGNFGVTASALQQDVKSVCDYLKPGIVQFPITTTQETEYLVVQMLRTIYEMDNQNASSCQYPYPWTQGKSLYRWMQQYLGGFNIRADTSAIGCCDAFGGLPLIRVPRDHTSDFALAQTIPWAAIAIMIPPMAELTRQAQSSQYALTNCAPNPPCKSQVGVNAPMCDQTYNLMNLSGGGIQYWMRVAWLTEKIDVGDACMAPHDALVTRQMFISSANAIAKDQFCANPPPLITGPLNPGGNCYYDVGPW